MRPAFTLAALGLLLAGSAQADELTAGYEFYLGGEFPRAAEIFGRAADQGDPQAHRLVPTLPRQQAPAIAPAPPRPDPGTTPTDAAPAQAPLPAPSPGDTVLVITADETLGAPLALAQDPSPAVEPATVARIQHLLAAIGYDPGPADAALGARTRIAIRAFQSDTGLPIDGQASPALASALAAAAGSDGLIALIQRHLDRLGFAPGPADGVVRPATRAALFAYYRARGIRGVLGLTELAQRLVDERTGAEARPGGPLPHPPAVPHG